MLTRDLRASLGNVLLLLAALVTTFALGEVALRIAGIEYPIFWQRDPYVGVAYIPDAKGRYRREGDAYVSINSQGLRDRERGEAAPSDAYRVAVLGDSYAAAFEVDAAEAFWAVAEDRLRGCSRLAGREPDFINFGVSGFGTAQEVQMWRSRAARYQPDLVLLLWVVNDVRNNSRALERDPHRPYYVLRDGRLVLDDSFLRTRYFAEEPPLLRKLRWWIGNRSRIVSLIGEFRSVGTRERMARTEAPVRSNMYVEPTEPDWVEAWQISELLVAKLDGEVREAGAGFLLALATDGYQVHPDPDERARHLAEMGGTDLLYANRRMSSFAEKSGIDFIDLAPALARHAETEGVCLHGFSNALPCDGHWNPDGHALAGRLIADEICERAGSRRPRG